MSSGPVAEEITLSEKALCSGQESASAPCEIEAQELPSLAEKMYRKGKLGDCLLILEAGTQHGLTDTRQKLIVQMHIAARSRDWWKVLQLEKGSEEKQIRTSYKRLAQQVHPDKCSCFGAEEAFQHLSEAVGNIMGAAEGGFVKDSAKPEQHAWWDKWDLDSSATKRKRRRDEDIVPQTEEEALNLRQCPIEDLKKEVAKRQKSVLRPEKGSDEAKLTPAQRQHKVRAARAILNERLSYVQNAAKLNGGFL